MFSRIARLIEPNLTDPHRSRQQRLLNLVLFGLAVPGTLFGIAILVLWAFGKTPITGAIAGLAVQPFYILSYWLGRKGKLTAAGYIPAGAVFLAMMGAGLQLGIGHVIYIGFAMATLTASILVGNNGGILVAILSTLANLGIGMLQDSGQIASALNPQDTFVADSIGLGLGLVVLVGFTGIYNSELQKSLQTQQTLSAELLLNQTNLESQIRNRTRDLERRLVQIRTAAEISRAISALLDPKALLQQVVDLVQNRFNLYYAGVFLVNPEGDSAVLQAGTGEAGKKMIAEGHRLGVGGNSMIGWATLNRKARIALDAGHEAVRFNNPHLPLTRSELALPILSGKNCLGALTVQSAQPEAFDEDDITVLQGIADSLATALENARLYQQAQENLEEVRKLHSEYLTRAWGEVKPASEVLSYTFENDQPSPAGERQNLLEFPISLREQVIGALKIERTGQDLSADEIAFIEAVTNETAVALENARLLEETQLRAEREQLLSQITEKVRTSSDVEVIMRTSILELGRALRASEGTIQLSEKD